MVINQKTFDAKIHELLLSIRDEKLSVDMEDNDSLRFLKECADRGYVTGVKLRLDIEGSYMGNLPNPKITREGLIFLERKRNAIIEYSRKNLIAFLALLVAVGALIVSIISITQ